MQREDITILSIPLKLVTSNLYVKNIFWGYKRETNQLKSRLSRQLFTQKMCSKSGRFLSFLGMIEGLNVIQQASASTVP